MPATNFHFQHCGQLNFIPHLIPFQAIRANTQNNIAFRKVSPSKQFKEMFKTNLERNEDKALMITGDDEEKSDEVVADEDEGDEGEKDEGKGEKGEKHVHEGDVGDNDDI